MLTVDKVIECVERHRATIWPVLDKIEYRPSGILPSEALILCCLSLQQNVWRFIESGRRHGYSTNCLASTLPQVTSIDTHEDNSGDTDSRLKAEHCSNLILISGDGSAVVPRLTNDLASEYIAGQHRNQITTVTPLRLAVLLDGPKGILAMDVVDKIIDKVAFAAIHDLSQRCEHPGGSQPNVSRTAAKQRYPGVFFTDAPEITEAYGRLDERAWKGTYTSRSELTACGFTLGIFCGGQWKE